MPTQPDTTTASRPSTTQSTEAFFYPPLPQSNHLPPTTPPLPPHPYQSYAPGSYDHRASAPPVPEGNVQLQAAVHPSASSVNVDPAGPTDKPKQLAVQQTYFVHHHHHHHHHHAPAPPPPPNPQTQTQTQKQRRVLHFPSFSFTESSVLKKYRYVIGILLFLPIPPLLSVLYIIMGHALLRRASSPPIDMGTPDPWAPTLLSSANAAATGGAILALPLLLALYILLPSHHHPRVRARTPRDDFFEDDDEESARGAGTVERVLAGVGGVVILLGVGGAAGALGVTCLGADGAPQGRARGMLTTARAAEAGVVGGAVLWGAMFVFAMGFVLGWWCLRDQGEGEGKEGKE